MIPAIEAYKQQMRTLTTEKEGLTNEVLQIRQEKAYQTAKKLFTAEGQAATNLDSHLRHIASVKPGRKLIKALEKVNCHLKVEIQDSFEFSPYNSTVHIEDIKTISYNTLNSSSETRKASAPTWISFAHELIHALHHFSNPDYDSQSTTCINIFPKMGTLEEQHTILGFSSKLISNKNPLTMEDIICENAFYMALGLPVRVDHTATAVEQELSVRETPGSYECYYTWLESTQKYISQIPEDKVNDKEFLFKFLCQNPAALKTLPPHLKNDADFMIKFITLPDVNLLEELPELRTNEDFMLKLFEFNWKLDPNYAMSKLPRDMLKSPTFIAKLTKFRNKPSALPKNTDSENKKRTEEKVKNLVPNAIPNFDSKTHSSQLNLSFRIRLIQCAGCTFKWIKENVAKLWRKLSDSLCSFAALHLNHRIFKAKVLNGTESSTSPNSTDSQELSSVH